MDDAFHAPAYLEFTKVSDELLLAMLYEMADMMISDLKQIEMEDTEEPTPDIDSYDAGDSLALLDYVDNIYGFYRENELSLP